MERPSPLSVEHLQVFRAAFLADPRPGFVLENDRPILANEAAKRLLLLSPTRGALLADLKAGVTSRTPGPALRLGTHRFILEFHPRRSRAGHRTRVCYLVKRTAVPTVLTRREREVLIWLASGSTNREIGERLGISIETVRKHVANALKRTGTKTRAGLVGRGLLR